MSLSIRCTVYIASVLALFSVALFFHTAHAGGGGFALEATQQQNEEHLNVVQETNNRMWSILAEENPAQFEANADARRATAEATLQEVLTGDDGNPMFIQRYSQERDEAGDTAYQQAVQNLSERYESPYISQTQARLSSYLQPANYSMSPDSVALVEGQDFSWDALQRVVDNPRGQTGIGQHFAARREAAQEREQAEQDFRDEAIGNSMMNPVRSDCDENGQNCRVDVPAALVERIAGDAATAGSRLQEMGDSVGETVDSSFSNMGQDVVRGSSGQLNLGQGLGLNVGNLFNELGLDPSAFGLDPNDIFSNVINQIGDQFGIGNINLSSPDAAAQSIVSAIGNEIGLGSLNISSPDAFAQSIANVMGNEMGIGNIDLSNPNATARSVLNAVGSELGIGNIDLSNPNVAMESLVNAALTEMNSGQTANFSDPSNASEIIGAAADDAEDQNSNFAATEVTTLLNTSMSIEEEHRALIEQAQDSDSPELVAYVNNAEDGGMSLHNQVLNNIVALNDLELELDQIRDAADGNYTEEQIAQVSEIVSEYADLYSNLSSEADVALLEEELANI